MMASNNGPDQAHWRFDKTISIGNIITLIGSVICMGYMANRFDQRMTIQEQFSMVQQQINAQHKSDLNDYKRIVREDVKELSAKVDRVLERLPRR
jgi:hypothetical protein